MTRTVYVAGPMESAPGNDLNEPLFDFVCNKLRQETDWQIFSPIELTRELIGPVKDLANMPPDQRKLIRKGLLKKELAWICDNADLIILLPGWENSSGTKAEKATAEALGIEVAEVPEEHLPPGLTKPTTQE